MNVFAIRHSETAWSLSGQHTGTTDIPLDLAIMRETQQLDWLVGQARPSLAIDEKEINKPQPRWESGALPVKGILE